MARRVPFVFALPAVILIASLAAVAQGQTAQQAGRIAVTDLKKKLDSGEKILFIDVREEWGARGARRRKIHQGGLPRGSVLRNPGLEKRESKGSRKSRPSSPRTDPAK